MSKFLSIIIPRYTETEREIFPLLSSINTQVGIDFSDIEVIISNDGTNLLDENFLNIFNMDLKQIILDKNCGPGVARQAGLDIAKGNYVIFCDADDVFHNVGVLNALIQEALKTDPDILVTSWLEEIMDGEKHTYITHEYENTWMHGKLLKRKFLVENNIRFHNELRVHEDSYFLCIAASYSKNSRFLPITSYVWKYNKNSITRCNDSSYTYDSIPEFIKACCLAHKEIEKYHPEEMEYKIVQFTLYNYFCFHQPGWQIPEHKKYLKDAENAFVKFITPMWDYWKNASSENIANIYNEERNKVFNNCIEFETVWAWLERLGLGK